MNTTEKHEKGYYMGMGIAIGLPIGIPLGLAIGNIAFGPMAGAIIGLALGWFLENKYGNGEEPGFLSELKRMPVLTILLSIGIAVFIFTLLALLYVLPEY